MFHEYNNHTEKVFNSANVIAKNIRYRLFEKCKCVRLITGLLRIV